MKILLVGEFSAYGGAKTYFRYLVEFYKRKNFQVILAITRRQLDSEIQSLLENGRQVRLVTIPERRAWPVALWARFPFSILLDIFTVVRCLREHPDLIVVSAAAPGSFVGLMALPYKILYVVHAYPADSPGTGVKSRARTGLYRIFFWLFIGKRKQIVAVSRFEKEVLIKRWMTDAAAKWISVIHNTSMLSFGNTAPKSHRSSPKATILTLGLVAWSKNPLLWIEAAKQVLERVGEQQEVEFVWAGDGDLLAECRERVCQLGISESVRFIGFQNEVAVLYETCDIYFQPSRAESHGMAVIDAMRFGFPCVVSRVGGLPESVLDGITGFVVDVDDINGMANRIVELVTSAELRKRMGQAAVERYNECFAHEAWEEKMMKLHLSVAG